MPKCHHCETTIVFGGVRDGRRRYCNQKCRDDDTMRLALGEIPPGFAEEKAQRIFEGPCPQCGGRGPNEVHVAYTIWALAIVTQFGEKATIGCQSCGTRARLKAIVANGLFGWWSMQGVLMTPVQIVRNLHGLMVASVSSRPSPEMIDTVRQELAKQLIEESRASNEHGE
jgi:hypothetical protein